jgi:hypothetical protein
MAEKRYSPGRVFFPIRSQSVKITYLVVPVNGLPPRVVDRYVDILARLRLIL